MFTIILILSLARARVFLLFQQEIKNMFPHIFVFLITEIDTELKKNSSPRGNEYNANIKYIYKQWNFNDRIKIDFLY